ncbi:hypothetical protein ABKN59_011487 [Abortiporus biennis]
MVVLPLLSVRRVVSIADTTQRSNFPEYRVTYIIEHAHQHILLPLDIILEIIQHITANIHFSHLIMSSKRWWRRTGRSTRSMSGLAEAYRTLSCLSRTCRAIHSIVTSALFSHPIILTSLPQLQSFRRTAEHQSSLHSIREFHVVIPQLRSTRVLRRLGFPATSQDEILHAAGLDIYSILLMCRSLEIFSSTLPLVCSHSGVSHPLAGVGFNLRTLSLRDGGSYGVLQYLPIHQLQVLCFSGDVSKMYSDLPILPNLRVLQFMEIRGFMTTQEQDDLHRKLPNLRSWEIYQCKLLLPRIVLSGLAKYPNLEYIRAVGKPAWPVWAEMIEPDLDVEFNTIRKLKELVIGPIPPGWLGKISLPLTLETLEVLLPEKHLFGENGSRVIELLTLGLERHGWNETLNRVVVRTFGKISPPSSEYSKNPLWRGCTKGSEFGASTSHLCFDRVKSLCRSYGVKLQFIHCGMEEVMNEKITQLAERWA